MNTYIRQYKYMFFLSWVLFYLIFPAWTLPVSSIIRAAVFFGLLVFFNVFAMLLSRWCRALPIDKPVFSITNWRDQIKNNVWLISVCCMAILLQIYPLSHPILILGDEAAHLFGGLVVYDYIDVGWHEIFQIMLWTGIALALLIRIMKSRLKGPFSGFFRSSLLKNVSVFLFFGVLVFWFFLLKDIHYNPVFIRYPPVSRILYFLIYSAFGIHYIGPRIIELIFYLLCSIYLYRTINLFFEQDTALLGAVLYLFLPIPFAYAHLAELANGTIFFMVACAFYFLRYIRDDDNRDLLITTYLIGTGCLYKKVNLLMFIVCITFLVVYKIKRREFHSLIPLKVLSISLVPIVPWMILTRYFSWRNYIFQLSNFTSLDGKMITYFPMLASNLSAIISIFLALAAVYVCFFKRNTLTAFFSLLFAVYYFFIVSDIGYLSPRFSMAFYPTFIIYLSLFITRMVRTIKWQHSFKLSFIVLTAYLVMISAVSPLNDRYLNIMNRKLIYFPSEKAMKWVKDNIKKREKIITVRIMSADFYRVKYNIENSRMIVRWYEIFDIETPEKLKDFCKKNNISYIMFPYSPKYTYVQPILRYLKDNREKEFVEIEKFNLDDNFIYIYKLKEV